MKNKDIGGKIEPMEKLLVETRTILLSGQVDDKLAKDIISRLLFLENIDREKPIHLIINSEGGSVSSGFAIFDMIRFIEPEVKIICAGLTASIATIILLAAKKENRLSLPNTKFLLHQPLIPMEVYGPASDLEITAREIMETKERINRIIAEETGNPFEKVERDTQRDFWLTAPQAKDYGLISRIITSRREI